MDLHWKKYIGSCFSAEERKKVAHPRPLFTRARFVVRIYAPSCPTLIARFVFQRARTRRSPEKPSDTRCGAWLGLVERAPEKKLASRSLFFPSVLRSSLSELSVPRAIESKAEGNKTVLRNAVGPTRSSTFVRLNFRVLTLDNVAGEFVVILKSRIIKRAKKLSGS